jgi:uncharacterized protein (TIGR03083 family)
MVLVLRLRVVGGQILCARTAPRLGFVTDAERLSGYVDVWWRAVDDFTHLLETVPPEEWSTPTDLEGWDVHACAAHTAHLESVLAGGPEETIEFEVPAHVRGVLGAYTEQGVVARRDRTPDELINEIRESCTARRTALVASPPTDASARPEVIFGGVDWSWERLLRNRPLDVWMHEQDVRRALDRPGGLDSPAAEHTTAYLLESLGLVLAKRAGAPTGTSLVVEVEGHAPVGFVVDAEGRGVPLAHVPADPTVGLAMSRGTFVVLAGGRRTPEQVEVTVTGDPDLAARVLAAMAVTP